MRSVKIIFLSVIAMCALAKADYRNTVGSKEAAIKASGAYRQEFERRMSGNTGFENTAKGLQELSAIINGPSLPSTPNYGKSLGEYMAELVMKSLKADASLKGIGIKNDDILDAIDEDIKKNKIIDDMSFVLNDISQDYEWKAELLLGIRDPGVVEKDLKAGYKAYEKALDYAEKSLELDNDKYKEDDQPEKVEKISGRMQYYIFRLAKLKLAGIGTSKDVAGAVKDFTEIAETEDKYSKYNAYRSYCILIPVYAYGSEGFEKNLDKVLLYSQKLANYSQKLKAEDVDNLNKEPVCSGAQPFIEPILADMKKTADAAKPAVVEAKPVEAVKNTKSAKVTTKKKNK